MDYENRVQKLRDAIDWNHCDAILISSAVNIIYLTGYANFSTHEREAYLLISKNDCYLFTDARYTEAVAKQVTHFTVLERSVNQTLNASVAEFAKQQNISRVGIEANDLRVSEFRSFEKHFKTITNSEETNQLRLVKDEHEISAIEKACQAGDKAIAYITAKIREDVTEKQLAAEFEIFLKQNGAEISFPPIFAFGANASVPHHETGQTMLGARDGRFVLIDSGAKVENYCSDMTRTFCFGTPNDQQKKMYQAVLGGQQAAAEFLDKQVKTGKKVIGKEVDKVARDFITAQGYPSFGHGLGHGIGLEVHEPPKLRPTSDDILEEGMVFSIEPGIYLPEFGGVRIEDLYVIEPNGIRQLTQSPKELIVL